jgi:hypothetical protein
MIDLGFPTFGQKIFPNGEMAIIIAIAYGWRITISESVEDAKIGNYNQY